MRRSKSTFKVTDLENKHEIKYYNGASEIQSQNDNGIIRKSKM